MGGKPPVVTLTLDQYTVLENDLNGLLSDECQKSWLLDYYEGKHDAQQVPKDYCASSLPNQPLVQGNAAQAPSK